jgi:hypothetical protein
VARSVLEKCYIQGSWLGSISSWLARRARRASRSRPKRCALRDKQVDFDPIPSPSSKFSPSSRRRRPPPTPPTTDGSPSLISSYVHGTPPYQPLLPDQFPLNSPSRIIGDCRPPALCPPAISRPPPKTERRFSPSPDHLPGSHLTDGYSRSKLVSTFQLRQYAIVFLF